jgi:transcriptional regulator with XRE-family HTH domain
MLKMSKQRTSLGDQFRQAVDASGLSRNSICKVIGIAKGSFSKFMAGDVGMVLSKLDRLADVLGLALVKTGKQRDIPQGQTGRPRKVR